MNTLELARWRFPVALLALAALASALMVIGAPVWISAGLGALAAFRVARPH
jgi:hypothetical protein